MAATPIPVVRVSRYQANGVASGDETPGNIVDGMTMVNDGATLLFVDNFTGGAETLTITIVETVDFSPAAPVVISVPDNTYAALLGPFPVHLYGNVLEFDVSDVGLNFAAFSLL